MSAKTPVTVARIDARHVRDLRRLVDLLCAIQVCWPTAEAEFHDDTIIVTVRRSTDSGAMCA